MRSTTSKLSSALDELNHPDLDHILLMVEESKPSTFPSKPEVESLIFDSFLDQCQRFLSQQSKFHQFSQKICMRATDIVNEIDKIQRYNKVSAKPEVESDIERILTKTELNAGREETLARIIEHLQIPDDLVKKIVDPRAEVDLPFFKAIEMLDKQKLLIVTLESFGESKLVESIKKSRGSLVNVAITKVLKNLPKLANITDFELLLQYKKLLGDNEENKRKFQEAILNMRKQLSKSHFAPIISELNYSLKKPIEEYYSDIFDEVLNKFNDERNFLEKLFPESKSKLLSELTSSFVLDVYFRLERCFFKAMEPLPLCKIKGEYLKYYQELRSMLGTQEYKSVHMESSLAKLDECIESVIKTESEKITKSKYNIYSVAGYMGIADNLKTLHECYGLDGKNPRWVEPFYRLAESRVPTDTNKSLVIFSINIWEIYLKVFGEELVEFQGTDMKQKASEMIEKGIQIFLSMNKKEFVQKVLNQSAEIPEIQKQAMDTLLKLCSTDPKKTLHSQLSLIIHQNLRNTLKTGLNSFVLEYYKRMIEIIKPMKNEQLKRRCEELGINIKTLGRAADTVEISTEQEMISILQ